MQIKALMGTNSSASVDMKIIFSRLSKEPNSGLHPLEHFIELGLKITAIEFL
jgi:hypothetical protein